MSTYTFINQIYYNNRLEYYFLLSNVAFDHELHLDQYNSNCFFHIALLNDIDGYLVFNIYAIMRNADKNNNPTV